MAWICKRINYRKTSGRFIDVTCRRVEFKLACLVRQALCGQMPIYLADDIHLVCLRRQPTILW